MNLIDLHVVEVLGEPYRYEGIPGRWFVDVMANGEGHVSENTVMCDSWEGAKEVQPGYVFQG
jgi:hypothetical protein